MTRHFEHAFPLNELLTWELHKETLLTAVIDEAEQHAAKALGQWFVPFTDVKTTITMSDNKLIVRFQWHASDEPQERHEE